MIKNYELNVFLNPSLTNEELQKAITKIKNYILDGKGIIINESEPEKRKLPYKVKKFNDAYYILIKFSYDTQIIANLRDKIKLTDGVIRSMISVAFEMKATAKNEESEVGAEVKAEQESEG
jgi:small subunit ribosomal protein S6